MKPNRIVVLTGAGISAESGLPTFRGAGGLWNGYKIEDVANPRAFRDDPQLVHEFYNLRRKAVLDPAVQPNSAHRALAELEKRFGPDRFCLITQNVDDLHERAGSQNVVHIHGELLKVRCTVTGEVFEWRGELNLRSPHPKRPELLGTLRPHIVWFGETPLRLPEVYQSLSRCDWFLAIGTSGNVYPAAGFVLETPSDCYRIEVNPDETPVANYFHEKVRQAASRAVPEIVAQLLLP